jgi:hypothetical protein
MTLSAAVSPNGVYGIRNPRPGITKGYIIPFTFGALPIFSGNIPGFGNFLQSQNVIACLFDLQATGGTASIDAIRSLQFTFSDWAGAGSVDSFGDVIVYVPDSGQVTRLAMKSGASASVSQGLQATITGCIPIYSTGATKIWIIKMPDYKAEVYVQNALLGSAIAFDYENRSYLFGSVGIAGQSPAT